jgi:hypothetical protein
VAGIEAQELFNYPIHDHAALGDSRKVRVLFAGLTDAESYEYRQAVTRGFANIEVDCRRLKH